MNLTVEQKERIAGFLRKQDEMFIKLPADARVQALSQIKHRIRQELSALGQTEVSDAQVESILGRMKISVKEKEPEPETVEEPEPQEADPSLKVESKKWSQNEADA